MIKTFYHSWCKKPEALAVNIGVFLVSFFTPLVLTWILCTFGFAVLAVHLSGRLNDW